MKETSTEVPETDKYWTTRDENNNNTLYEYLNKTQFTKGLVSNTHNLNPRFQVRT
jgi:hypothetical protein